MLTDLPTDCFRRVICSVSSALLIYFPGAWEYSNGVTVALEGNLQSLSCLSDLPTKGAAWDSSFKFRVCVLKASLKIKLSCVRD